MDLTSLYSDFVMDGREMLFHSAPGYVSSFHDNEGNVYCAVPAFQHSDADLARDPLSTNRRLVDSDELELFGTMVVAGATSDHIKVLIPDTFSGPTLNASSPVVLQHVVGLTLGSESNNLYLPTGQHLCYTSLLSFNWKNIEYYIPGVHSSRITCTMINNYYYSHLSHTLIPQQHHSNPQEGKEDTPR